MKLEGLQQSALNTSRMGVLRGVANYFRLAFTDAMLFGASGHAFLINIHNELCPCGPYCWNDRRVTALTRNLGIDTQDLGFFDANNGGRAQLEATVRNYLDEGLPCSLLNLEHQLITGYDETGFTTECPWPGDFPPARLSFGSWAELGEEMHVSFYVHRKVEPVTPEEAIAEGIRCGVDMHRKPAQFTETAVDCAYGVGPDAWTNWLNCIDTCGDSHGHWWNATVWAECRLQGARFLREVSSLHLADADALNALATQYEQIGCGLEALSPASVPSAEKRKCLPALGEADEKAAELLAELAENLCRAI